MAWRQAGGFAWARAVWATFVDVVSFWFERFMFWLILRRLRARALRAKLTKAETYSEWLHVAADLDTVQGKDGWRDTPDSSLFDADLISGRLRSLAEARASGDIDQIIFVLRAGLIRNLGGIGNPKLYAHCLTGTKYIIEEYLSQVNSLLEYLALEAPGLTTQAKYELLVECQQSFGRTALVLSGGAALGVYHLGVVRALLEAQLLPRVIYGTAVGAMIAALVCVHSDESLQEIFKPGGLNLQAFSRNKDGKGAMRRRISRLLTHGVLMDVSVLEACVRDNIGDITFEEAYARTGRILNITVNSPGRNEAPLLLNYLTAPNVIIWSAACASCAVPGLYEDVPLLVKDFAGRNARWTSAGHRLGGGTSSIESELPSSRLSELFNVNHFILSQMSPHIVPLLPRSSMKFHDGPGALLKAFLRSELKHRLVQLAELDLLPRWTIGLLNTVQQIYKGDIIIVPDLSIRDIRMFLATPNDDFLQMCILRGQQSTWPQLNLIKGHLTTERCLERLVDMLRSELDSEKKRGASREQTPPTVNMPRRRSMA